MTTMQDNGMILLMCQKKIIPFIEFHTKKKKSRTNVIEKKFKQTKSLPWAHWNVKYKRIYKDCILGKRKLFQMASMKYKKE